MISSRSDLRNTTTASHVLVILTVVGIWVTQWGCRSQLPADQPSRLHEVYSMQNATSR